MPFVAGLDASTEAKPSRCVPAAPARTAAAVGEAEWVSSERASCMRRPGNSDDNQPGWSDSSPSAAEASSFTIELWLALCGCSGACNRACTGDCSLVLLLMSKHEQARAQAWSWPVRQTHSAQVTKLSTLSNGTQSTPRDAVAAHVTSDSY
jgi:hypothetical protein